MERNSRKNKDPKNDILNFFAGFHCSVRSVALDCPRSNSIEKAYLTLTTLSAFYE